MPRTTDRPIPRAVTFVCTAIAAGAVLFAATQHASAFERRGAMRPAAKTMPPTARTDNWEMVVKVLNASSPLSRPARPMRAPAAKRKPRGGAMTNVEYTITVTDTQ